MSSSVQIHNLAISNAERALQASLFAPDEGAKPAAVLFLQGYNSPRGNYTDIAEAVSGELGATCLTVAGHGEAEGELKHLTALDHVEDMAIAYDLLSRQPGVDPKRIGVMGASYGGYLAALLCRSRNPKSLLLRAPAIHEALPEGYAAETDGRASDTEEELRASLPENGVLRVVSEFGGSITLVESERDEAVSREGIEACLEVADDVRLRIIKGARHALHGETRSVFKDMLIEWAWEL